MFRQNSMFGGNFHKTTPHNYIQIPDNLKSFKPTDNKLFENKPIETKPIENKPIETKPIENKPTETIIVDTNLIDNKIIEKPESIFENEIKDDSKFNFIDKNELYEFINNKFSRLDEALLTYKQEKLPIKCEIPNEIDNEKLLGNKEKLKYNKNNENLTKKQKKAYESIDDSLYDKVKEKYPNFPDDKKNNIVIDNDGNFFINKNKKKIPLNNVNTLRLINKK